jgi:hypothetical protein
MHRAAMGGDWTDSQNDAIVADSFVMQTDDIVARPYTGSLATSRPSL